MDFWPAGSTGLIAMASASSMFSVSRMSRFCSSTAPVFVVLNATATSGNSASAFSHPLRAIVQKFEVVLVMNATVFTALGALGAGESQLTEIAKARANKQMTLDWVDLFIVRVPRGKE